MAGARDDEYGWKRGVGAYSSNYAKFDHPIDKKSVKSLDTALMSRANSEKPGPVSKGGPPRYRPKTGPRTNGGN